MANDLTTAVENVTNKFKKRKTSLERPLRLRVSRWAYSTFNTKVYFDVNQTSIADYLDEVSKEQGLIRKLLGENTQLKKELERSSIQSVVMKPTFFQKLSVIQKGKASKKKKIDKHSDDIVKVGLYYFLIGGRSLYETMAQNLPLPSMSVIYKYLYEKKSMVEGSFIFTEVLSGIIKENYSTFVWVAEDDTKVTEGLSYNRHEDTVVGLCLPVNTETGTPIKNFYAMTSIKDLKEYLIRSQQSTYVKLITVKPLNINCKTFILALYGTNGSDKAYLTKNRWDYIQRKFKEIGITVMGKFKF